MRVLVADDDRTTRTFLKRLLIRNVGCMVTAVENGLEALAQLDRVQYSAAAARRKHAGHRGGLETLEAIRGSTHGSLPVVMMTALEHVPSRNRSHLSFNLIILARVCLVTGPSLSYDGCVEEKAQERVPNGRGGFSAPGKQELST